MWLSMGVNSHFGTIKTNRPHAIPNYGPRQSKFEIDCYRQTHCFPEKPAYIWVKLEKSEKEVMYFSKYFNSNYMNFLVMTHVKN